MDVIAMGMRHAVYLPTYGEFADPGLLADLAGEAESAGWDGVFTWDHVAMWWDRAVPVADTTVALGAIALATSAIRFGALVTPLARRRPVKYARETASLDRLSGGRLIAGVGLGMNEHEFEHLGEEADAGARGRLLDEALDLVVDLWSGLDVEHTGDAYETSARFLPTPVQRPRIPVWVAGAWPHRSPFLRAARWDGAVPMLAEPGPFDTPADVYRDVRELVGRVRDRGSAPFDMAHAHGDPDLDLDRRARRTAPYEEAGVTWWLEDLEARRFGYEGSGSWPFDDMRAFVAAGPARS